MTKYDFFRLIIKILVFYFVIQSVFMFIPQVWSLTTLGFIDISGVVFFLAAVLLTVLIVYFLVSRPDKIIRLFRLDKGYDDEFIKIGELSSKLIFKTAIVIIGALLVFNSIGSFIAYLYMEVMHYFKENQPAIPIDEVHKYFIIHSLNIIVGYLLLINNTRLASYFLKLDIENNESGNE